MNLVILPEMFTTGFTLDTEGLDETIVGPTADWMVGLSLKNGFTLMGSFICEEEGRRYNRLLVSKPNGEIAHYDKRHLFTFAKEDEFFNRGDERLTVDVEGTPVCPLICYDLRFPVWSRNIENHEFPPYDVLIYVANWPSVRAKAWSDLLVARAHENQSFVIGVNRVGEDGNGIHYSGDSVAIDPKGNIIASASPNEEGWIITELNLNGLEEFREKFRPLDDADDFELKA